MGGWERERPGGRAKVGECWKGLHTLHMGMSPIPFTYQSTIQSLTSHPLLGLCLLHYSLIINQLFPHIQGSSIYTVNVLKILDFLIGPLRYPSLLDRPKVQPTSSIRASLQSGACSVGLKYNDTWSSSTMVWPRQVDTFHHLHDQSLILITMLRSVFEFCFSIQIYHNSNLYITCTSLNLFLLYASTSFLAYSFPLVGYQPIWLTFPFAAPLMAYIGRIQTISNRFHKMYTFNIGNDM